MSENNKTLPIQHSLRRVSALLVITDPCIYENNDVLIICMFIVFWSPRMEHVTGQGLQSKFREIKNDKQHAKDERRAYMSISYCNVAQFL